MWKDLASVLGLVFLVLGIIYFKIGKETVFEENILKQIPLHAYNQPEVSIAKVKVAVFYFVPKNENLQLYSNWRETLEKNLKNLKTFHTLQFQSRSDLEYEIYYDPIIGLEDNLFYDTLVTQYGNPEGLKNVRKELITRGFIKPQEGAYNVALVMYEGVGASGSEKLRTAFFSRKYLSEAEYKNNGPSIVFHEFYHTLGIPDRYEKENGREVIWSADIMGSERGKNFKKTHIDNITLRGFGL